MTDKPPTAATPPTYQSSPPAHASQRSASAARCKPSGHSRRIVTAALPYANGDAHMGHLVEYILTDTYVRGLKLLGEDVRFICASDAHGTPIELNAAKQGIEPQTLVDRVRERQQRDFARFGIAFDHFGNTHAPSNQALVNDAYQVLKGKGLIEERELLGTYCAHDKRFLPDRFVKGSCPRCGAEDQYGDVCERCGATYGPEDLVAPKCALCGNPPERKPSRHIFFRLSDPAQSDFLRRWIDSGTLQEDVANYVRSWLDGGLKDWCISRDAPYFGFPVPDMPGKFFYVWLDAPFGYVASSAEWGQKNGIDLAALWRSPDTRIEHVIGKDIMYFHTLFWPAVLRETDYTLPAKVHVHGMLTINGEKMSKSRGTFINAACFADHVEPEILRYYFATKYTPESRDIALSFDDMVARINGELINKYVNLFSRLGRFVHAKLDGRLGPLPFSHAAVLATTGAATDSADATSTSQRTTAGTDKGADVIAGRSTDLSAGTASAEDWPARALHLARKVVALAKNVEVAYAARDIARVTRELSQMADLGNEEMQLQQPWSLAKSDVERARSVCTVVANVCDALIAYLYPIVPELATRAAKTFGTRVGRADHAALFRRQNVTLGAFERLLERLEPEALARVVEATRQAAEAAAAAQGEVAANKETSSATTAPGSKTAAPADASAAQIPFAHFAGVQLKVGTILQAAPLPKSKKLLRLAVDLGEAAPRQILAGIALAYAAETLVGSQVICVTNLAPATIMGQVSNGMVLAGDDVDGQPVLLRPSKPLPPGAAVH